MGWWDPMEYAAWLDPVDWPRPMPGDWMRFPYTRPVDERYLVQDVRRDASGVVLIVCGDTLGDRASACEYAREVARLGCVDDVRAVQSWTPDGIVWYRCPLDWRDSC